MRETVPKQTEKLIAQKTAEAMGLLVLVKPLIKRAGTLTPAEQEMMTDTIGTASRILSEAMRLFWEARSAPETAVRMNGDRS